MTVDDERAVTGAPISDRWDVGDSGSTGGARPVVAVTRPRLPGAGIAGLSDVADVRTWDGDRPPDTGSIVALCRDAVAVVGPNGDRMDTAFFDACPSLRLVAIASAGYDSVDVAAASARGVAVTNTPGVLAETTADLAFGLILAARRRIAEGDRWVRAGAWTSVSLWTMLGHDIHGATLGILGYGEIGRAVARRGRGFRMTIVHHSRHRADDELSTWLPLDELLVRSDIVSIHLPATPQTRGLIGDREIGLMKPTATLVNTGRGGTVDEAALVRALRAGRLASAGLDVQAREPNPDADDPLLTVPSLVVLPHVGGATMAARIAMFDLAAANARAFLEGAPLLTPVVPSPSGG
jgi:lactate dehydrogenase-like 2-hydroxyacid dehydrogenase